VSINKVKLKSENRFEPFDPCDSFVQPRDCPPSQGPSTTRVQPQQQVRKDSDTFQSEMFTNLVTVSAYYLTRKALQKVTNLSGVPNAQELNFSPRTLHGSTTNHSATSALISVDSKWGIGGKVPPLVIPMLAVPKFGMTNPKVGGSRCPIHDGEHRIRTSLSV
jgi:hypothetical protein